MEIDYNSAGGVEVARRYYSMGTRRERQFGRRGRHRGTCWKFMEIKGSAEHG